MMSLSDPHTVFTIGHSNHPIDRFINLLRRANVDMLADIRSLPRSRWNPQYNDQSLASSLAGAGIDYIHMPALGGKRSPAPDAPPSPNRLWPEGGLRNYADYALTLPFRRALNELVGLARERRCAIMCAEADWRDCHRRLTTDNLLTGGLPVVHLLPDRRSEPAVLTAGAIPQENGLIFYPPETRELSLT